MRSVAVLRGPVRKLRHVRTPEGERRYKLPIGSPIGRVNRLLAAYPRTSGEPVFVWQSRVVNGLSQSDKAEVLYRLRERYAPVDVVVEGAKAWRSSHGLPEPKADISVQHADSRKADKVARAFEMTADEANNPRVRLAFEDFKRQNAEQFAFITRPRSAGGLGITVEFVADEPYPSARAQAEDVRRNHRIKIQSGLGGVHSLMTTTEYDHFRAVHDIFGHVGIGGGFDRHGEYQAWLSHMTMYDGPGRDAMSSEYHGVNSAMWAGAPGTPGTGRSILLPDSLIQSPWDDQGNLVRKEAGDFVDLVIHSAALDTSFAIAAEAGPWHRLSPTVAGVTKARAVVVLRAPFEKTRHVRSADGARRYKEPIGSPIVSHPRVPGKGAAHALGEAVGGGAKPNLPGNGAPSVPNVALRGEKGKPVKVRSVDEAIRLLAEGKHVELKESHQVSTLTKKLAAIVKDAERRGDKAPTYDLCKVTVKGTSLFCAESKGIPRLKMPQLQGPATPGSKAAKLVAADAGRLSSRGEVNLYPEFVKMLEARGIKFEVTSQRADFLKASQNELNGAKVAGIAGFLRGGGKIEGPPLFTSRDDYIVDGHHRWAAQVAIDLDDGKPGDEHMSINRVDMDIISLLDESNRFANEWGIPQASVAKALLAAFTKDDPTPAQSSDSTRLVGTVSTRPITGAGAHKCSVCGKRMRSAAAFRVHRAMHAKTRKALEPACVDCGNADDTHDSIMVALYPPPAVAASLALAGGENPDELHVTLAYLGKIPDQPVDKATIEAAVAEVAAAETSPMEGSYNGLGRFVADDRGEGWPLVALVDVPGLSRFREDLVDALDEAGAEVADNHGFTPHTTLAYVAPPDEPAAQSHLDAGLGPIDVRFASVWLCWGDERIEIPLGAPSRAAVEFATGVMDRFHSVGAIPPYEPVYRSAVTKAVEEKRFTLGPLYPATDAPTLASLDAHNEFVTSDDLQASVWKYMRNNDRRIRLQHTDGTEIGECVELMCMPGPVTVPLRLPSGQVVEKSFGAGTPFMGVVWNEVGWPLVQKGAIRGYSFGGMAQRLTVTLDD